MSLGWAAPSEDELQAGGDFTTLPEEEYIAKVRSIEIKSMKNNFPSKGDMEPMHDMIVVKADAISFSDGEPLIDEAGEPVEDGPVPFQVYLNPKKRGMIPQPSKTRKFFAAVLGQNLGDPIEVADFGELVGKEFIVSLKPNKGYNNANDFRAIRRQRARATTPKGPVDGAELKTRTRAVFDEDAPDNTSPLPATSSGDDELDF